MFALGLFGGLVFVLGDWFVFVFVWAVLVVVYCYGYWIWLFALVGVVINL